MNMLLDETHEWCGTLHMHPEVQGGERMDIVIHLNPSRTFSVGVSYLGQLPSLKRIFIHVHSNVCCYDHDGKVLSFAT